MTVWRRRVRLRRPESASEAIPDGEQPHSHEAQREIASAFGYPFELSRIVQFPDVEPVFVLGLTRSGTSAMANALRQGAGLFGWSEGHLFPALDDLLVGLKKTWDDAVRYTYAPGFPRDQYAVGQFDVHVALNAVVRTFDAMYRVRALRWVDKTALAEAVLAAPLWSHIYPNARFIYMHRHPIKVALSRKLKFPTDSLVYSFDLWAACMQAWARVRAYLPDDSYLELEQAHLSQRTAEVVASVGAFLGLDQSEQHAVQDYLAENRPEYTGSAPDDGEVLLEDTGWNRAERRACRSICAETASAWGTG